MVAARANLPSQLHGLPTKSLCCFWRGSRALCKECAFVTILPVNSAAVSAHALPCLRFVLDASLANSLCLS